MKHIDDGVKALKAMTLPERKALLARMGQNERESMIAAYVKAHGVRPDEEGRQE